MHREISQADAVFGDDRHTSLYLLTALLGALLLLDLWPTVVGWSGLSLPAWPRELFGYRFALAAAVIGTARALYGAVDSLLDGRLGADLALALASLAAILINEPLEAAAIVFVGLAGECLEHYTFSRTKRALHRLAEVFPRRCWVLRDGQEVRVLVGELKIGDRVVIKPGAKVPVDGVVVDGESSLDQSPLTGESLPVDVRPGSEVLAGSVNQYGAVTVEARHVGEQTAAGQIIELTGRALKEKAPLERAADRLARYFLPTVLTLAALTFAVGMIGYGRLGWAAAARQSVYPALAVLVVSCPCALILATPAAIIAALGRLAGTGVLVKGGGAIERLARVTTFAFDKTGTLTEGRLELGDLIPVNGTSPDDLLQAAATAEQRSEHPLGRLVVAAAAGRGLLLAPLEAFTAHPGGGVTAGTAGTTFVIGSPRFLEEQGITLEPPVAEAVGRLDAAGQTPLLVARAGFVLGAIGARDRVRPEAAEVLTQLRALGIAEIALLTGDREGAAAAVATQLGITTVHARLLPAQKAAVLSTLGRSTAAPPISRGERTGSGGVAMVGDGINDAPALARADVGLAVAGAVDLAAEAGDILLLGDPLRTLPLLTRLSRETVRVIRQNILIFAFGVNAVGIVGTAWLWPLLMPESAPWAPMVGVIYHQLGSLAVLLNSMRLLWFERATPLVWGDSAWDHTRHFVRRLDEWFERYLNPDEAWHVLGHHWREILAGSALVALLAYGLSGLIQVGPDEIAVVRRFGRPLDEDLGPGLWYRWPWPFEAVTRLKPDQIRVVAVGARSEGRDALGGPTNLAWDSRHADPGRPGGEESIMMTGDGDLIEVQAAVRYQIDRTHLRQYLFEVADPDETVRAAAEAVLRELVAGRPFLDLLTVRRQAFQQDVLHRLEDRCDRLGLGIRFDGVSLLDVHPPREVVPAYHDVTRAMEERARRVNEAEADALRTVREARSRAVETVRAAQTAAKEKTLQARAELDSFLARQRARAASDDAAEVRLFRDAVLAVAFGRDHAAVAREYVRIRDQRNLTRIQVSDARRFWDAVSAALAGRDKVIVDTDRVPGRRSLWLFDPESLRGLIPKPIPGRPGERMPGRAEPPER